MAHRRATDFPEDPNTSRVSGSAVIRREITLWQILSVIGSIFLAMGLGAISMRDDIRGMKDSNLQIRNDITVIRQQGDRLSGEVREITAKLSVKDTTDSEQNLRINEMSRRMTIMEASRGGNR